MVLPTSARMSGGHGGQRLINMGVAGQRVHMGDEPATVGVADCGCNHDFDAELVRPVSLAFADAFDLRRVQGVDVRPALIPLLFAYAVHRRQQLSERRFEPAVSVDPAGDVADDAAETEDVANAGQGLR
jgi:hypothetical protein